jgi:hypothetical protein
MTTVLNTTAYNLVRSWLRANKIPFTKSDTEGCHLTVQGRLGDIDVRLLATATSTEPLDNCIDVLASDITHKRLDVAFAAYGAITNAAGYGTLKPVDRGPQPEQKLCYTDEDFLVCVRHTALRRSPDAPIEKFAKYDKVMHKACWNFYNLNIDACRRWGMSVEDLRTNAMVMLNIFCAQIENEDRDDAHNEKTLYVWLRQRFAETFKIQIQKGRSNTPDADTVAISLLQQPYRGWMDFEKDGTPSPIIEEGAMSTYSGSLSHFYDRQDNESDDEDYKKRNRKLDTSNPTARKRSASKLLNESLEAMGHDKMVETLGFAHQNILIHPDASREAGKRLKEHVLGCGTCKDRLKTVRLHAFAEDESSVKTHLQTCKTCEPNQYLIAVLAEIDVDEQTGVEGLGTEE